MHVGGLSDEELVTLARAGHEPAFDAIVHRYRGPLVSYCRRWLDVHRAEEVVQHTLMKAFLCVRDDVRPLAVRPWLYRVAHNAALNAVEKKGSEWEELDENYDGVPQPPQIAEQRAHFLKIVDEIGALPARQREALVLNEFEGRCYADIAAELGTSESGVRGLLRRARRQLRETAAALLPIPVLRELVRSDGGRGAGDLIGTASAAGGVSAAGGFAKLAAGVLAAGTIASGGTAIQQSGEGWKAPDAKAADTAKQERPQAEDPVRSVLSDAADEVEAARSTVSRITVGGAELGAGADTTAPTSPGGGWIGGVETDSRNTAQPVEESEEEPLLPLDDPTVLDGDEGEQPSGETQEEPPATGEADDGTSKNPDSAEQPSAQEQPGPNEHTQESDPSAIPATPLP